LIVADTHALLWWVGDRDRLSARARELMDANDIHVSAITCFEIVRLVDRDRFRLTIDVRSWLEELFASTKLAVLPVTMEVGIVAARLRDPVRDPIDRIIVATALLQGVPLVTKDHKIIASGVVTTIW